MTLNNLDTFQMVVSYVTRVQEIENKTWSLHMSTCDPSNILTECFLKHTSLKVWQD